MAPINITIKCSNSSTVVISAEPEIQISEFKALVQAQLETPPEQQRLIYKGRVLKDQCTLQFYGTETS
jgi:ubiquilin